MFPAQTVVDCANGFIGVPVVVEFMSAVQGGAVKFDVTMNVVPVCMGGHDKLMLAAGKLQSKLIT